MTKALDAGHWLLCYVCKMGTKLHVYGLGNSSQIIGQNGGVWR